MKHKRNVAIALVLSAAAGFLALHTTVSAPTPDSAPQTPAKVETIVTSLQPRKSQVQRNAPTPGHITTHPN